MNIEEAKQIDIVDFLERIGISPSRISGNSYWFLSPFREERTASFKVNRNLNRWYDFAEGRGGNLIDFGTLLYKCDVSSLLNRLSNVDLAIKQQQKLPTVDEVNNSDPNRIKITSIQNISSYPLLKYLQTRRINHAVAQTYLKQVHYQLDQKEYYALGFKNDAGGYELRNQYTKISSSPKDTTFIDKGAKDVAVFEGFFNFLSYKNMYYNQEEPSRNYLILNSASFFDKSLSKMQEHNEVHLYLDNDRTGEKLTQKAIGIDKAKYIDERILYKNYEDLNDWLMKIGNSLKHQLRPKL